MITATRALPIGLPAVILVALLGGACGSSSTAKPDGGGGDAGGGDHFTTSNLLVGNINPGAPPPCITESLLLAYGFSIGFLAEIVADGYATASKSAMRDLLGEIPAYAKRSGEN